MPGTGIEYTQRGTAIRRLIGGERFSIVVERDVPLLGMSRIDTVAEAWDRVGNSRYFYVIGPTREGAALGDQRVGTLSIRTRADQANALPVSVGQGIDDLSRQLGFMRIRRVDSVDAKAATDVAKQAEKTAEEREKGAGQTPLQRAAETVKKTATAAKASFEGAFGLVKLVLVVGAIVGVAYALKQAKDFNT